MLNRNASKRLLVRRAFNLSSTTTAANFESVAMPQLNDLYRTALYLLQQPAQASAAVEETFFRARKTIGQRPFGIHTRIWLFQILIQAIRFHRMQLTGSGRTRIDHWSSSTVVSAISMVPVDFREILLLIDGLGFSYVDAATILGLSEDAITHRLIQARNQLQSQMKTAGAASAVVAM
jgi:RNA polymerase sigma-70 factor, ECF subfamily